jgi:16S rRNA (adenine1518-N6/adenine1519-N6)-dimethyltransferase
MKLSEMRELLAREDIQLTKSLGQNFLHDGNQLRRIISAAELTKADKVLEIGPGLGPLTELLLQNAGEVLAIEKDARLVQVLRQRFSGYLQDGPRNAAVSAASSGGVSPPRGTRSETLRELAGEDACATRKSEGRRKFESIHSHTNSSEPPTEKKLETGETPVLRLLHDDALEFLKREPHDWREWKLVANLPYSVASPILVELAQGARSPQRMVATLQLEVARRLMAQAGDKDYGLLTLLVQLDFEPRDWFKVPAGCFFPQPDVDSACVILERRHQPFLPEELRGNFHSIVKRAFSQRRKMMLKLLKTDWPETLLMEAFEKSSLSPQVRAEAVSVPQFVALTRLLR